MGRKNPNIHPNAKQASSFLSFFLYFSSLMLFISLFFFLFWCGMLFYLCPSCFQQWLEVLKTIWMVCSLVIPNRDWGRKYDLWTSNTLIHCHQSWECREWIYQVCLPSPGTARTKIPLRELWNMNHKQTPINCFNANN